MSNTQDEYEDEYEDERVILNDAERIDFRNIINAFCAKVRNRKIRCYKNYMCCGSCAIKKLVDTFEDESFIFYHAQEQERLKEGSNTCYFHTRITSTEDYNKLLDVIKKFQKRNEIYFDVAKGNNTILYIELEYIKPDDRL